MCALFILWALTCRKLPVPRPPKHTTNQHKLLWDPLMFEWVHKHLNIQHWPHLSGTDSLYFMILGSLSTFVLLYICFSCFTNETKHIRKCNYLKTDPVQLRGSFIDYLFDRKFTVYLVQFNYFIFNHFDCLLNKTMWRFHFASCQLWWTFTIFSVFFSNQSISEWRITRFIHSDEKNYR